MAFVYLFQDGLALLAQDHYSGALQDETIFYSKLFPKGPVGL